MPINKETIISVFDDKLTLMQWLKTINKALEDAVLTGVEITKKGNATLSFKFTFEDGTYLESNDLVLQQGESVNGAYIQNGHLYLTLTNGTNLDAGNVKPVSNFSINNSQHLIVNYGDGTSQDLGAIFNGNVNIAGNLTADSIIENMTGYSMTLLNVNNLTITPTFGGIVKTGNKITFVFALNVIRTGNVSGNALLVNSNIPTAVGRKLYPSIGSYTIDRQNIYCVDISNAGYNTNIIMSLSKQANDLLLLFAVDTEMNKLQINEPYYIRYECTFLLSDNLLSNE